MGSSGVFAGSLVIITRTSPLEKRPVWQGLISAMYGIASVIGPLWGGTQYTWDSGRIVALFFVCGITLVSFGILQWRLGDKATIPPRIVTQRTIWSASWFAFFLSGSFYLFIYFIPYYFQAVKGASALSSSIDNLPLILSNVVLAVASGVGVSKLGYINPFCYAAVVFTSVGAGLLTTLTADTSTARWIGFQIIFGVGVGLGFQQPPNAPQAVLPIQDLPIGISITLFCRNLGASLFVTAGNNVIDNQLHQGFAELAIPGVDVTALVQAGAISFRSMVPTEYFELAVQVYVDALRQTYQIGLIISCIAIIGAACIEWKTLKKPSGAPPPAHHPSPRSPPPPPPPQSSVGPARVNSQRNRIYRLSARIDPDWIQLDDERSDFTGGGNGRSKIPVE
ncbi:hypothetical protein KJ359_003778 [Pestalotiopsis sp. 9143b]|nr:hypothetical protein KJ359_003778 [Pestalotiopsis sp. 9143b]